MLDIKPKQQCILYTSICNAIKYLLLQNNFLTVYLWTKKKHSGFFSLLTKLVVAPVVLSGLFWVLHLTFPWPSLYSVVGMTFLLIQLSLLTAPLVYSKANKKYCHEYLFSKMFVYVINLYFSIHTNTCN